MGYSITAAVVAMVVAGLHAWVMRNYLAASSNCVEWHQTSGCATNGPREPENDGNCKKSLTAQMSGICICKDKPIYKDCVDNVFSDCEHACSDYGKVTTLRTFGENIASATGIVYSPQSDSLFVAEHYRVLEVQRDGRITLIAGSKQHGYQNAVGEAARFNQIYGIALTASGSLLVTDYWNNVIRQIDTITKQVTTVAGTGTEGYLDGVPLAAELRQPRGIAVSNESGAIFFTDVDRIRRFLPGAKVTTIAGSDMYGSSDGFRENARFNNPWGTTLQVDGSLVVVDYHNHKIRHVNVTSGEVRTLAGSVHGFLDGTHSNAQFYLPRDVVAAIDGTLYIADRNNHRIRRMDTHSVTTLAGNGQSQSTDGYMLNASINDPIGLTVTQDNYLYVLEHSGPIRIIDIKKESRLLQESVISIIARYLSILTMIICVVAGMILMWKKQVHRMIMQIILKCILTILKCKYFFKMCFNCIERIEVKCHQWMVHLRVSDNRLRENITSHQKLLSDTTVDSTYHIDTSENQVQEDASNHEQILHEGNVPDTSENQVQEDTSNHRQILHESNVPSNNTDILTTVLSPKLPDHHAARVEKSDDNTKHISATEDPNQNDVIPPPNSKMLTSTYNNSDPLLPHYDIQESERRATIQSERDYQSRPSLSGSWIHDVRSQSRPTVTDSWVVNMTSDGFSSQSSVSGA